MTNPKAVKKARASASEWQSFSIHGVEMGAVPVDFGNRGNCAKDGS